MGMWKMKKKALITISVIIVLVIFCIVGTGLMKRTDVILLDYSVSEGGTEITLRVGVASSMGYTRGYKNKGGGEKPHYLTFYSTFGGFNSTLGAKNEFVLRLDKDDTEIYFNRADGGYELVLKKNEKTGMWERP